jgi:ribonuclease HI
MNSEQQKKIIVHTDGACIGNPGAGGYGVVLQHGEHRKEISAGFKETTNNRMELMAVIEALKALKSPSNVMIYSDSKYVVETMQKGSAQKWSEKGWMRTKKDKARNTDLWGMLLDLCHKHNVTFSWVKGHAGNIENERCDWLSDKAARGSDLQIDTGYDPSFVPRKSKQDIAADAGQQSLF